MLAQIRRNDLFDSARLHSLADARHGYITGRVRSGLDAEHVRTLARWYREGRRKPHVSARFPLEQAADAMNLLASRKAKGKVVVTIGD